MNIKHIITISLTLLLVVTSQPTKAQDQEKLLFEKANAAYNNGDFQTAVDGYGEIENLGKESVSLYFNKANAYYKLKNYPMAILYYEKALVLDPSNEDVKNNLQIANLTKVDKIDEVPQPVFVRWWNAAKAWLSSNVWAWTSIAFLTLALAFLFVFLVSRTVALRKTGFFASLMMFVLFALSVLFAAQSRRDCLVRDDAIIITPSVTMMSAPVRSGEELLVLHEGTKVKIVEHSDDWNKVKLSDGNIGWIKAADMIEF